MLLFGHPGITLGAAVLLTGVVSSLRKQKAEANASRSKAARQVTESGSNQPTAVSWLESLASQADIRVLLIGSLLPDIIDKPVGQLFFRDFFNNGRIFSHTFLFLALITAAGLYLYRSRGKTWLLVLSFGTFMHLLLDEMWLAPRTLWWPIYGFAFEAIDLTHWGQNILRALFTIPEVYVPELVGLAILVWLAQLLLRRKMVLDFIKCGRLR